MFYMDHPDANENYSEFIGKELVKITRRMFPLSHKKEDTFIAGLSMGGYGALKCALTYPERYKGAAAFSCVSDVKALLEVASEGRRLEAAAIFGEDFPEKDDLFVLAEKAVSLPPFYITCGDEDRLFPHSEMIRDTLIAKGADVTFEHWEGGHEWAFWDRSLSRAFELFFS